MARTLPPQPGSAGMIPTMVRDVDVVRVRGANRAGELDCVAAEEPLEIRLHDRPFVVVMRTPGADCELAAGFLLAERVISSADDLATIAHCSDPDVEHRENIVNVRLADEARADAALGTQRRVAAHASCGMCGRRSIEEVMAGVPAVETAVTIAAAVIAGLPRRLREAQVAFDVTGGLHAAGLFAPDGRLIDIAEDVGRHNAVDKVVGRKLLREELPIADAVLCVSGRTSFEIVQKAALGGISIVAAVSAPSSLAIQLAVTAGVTLVGFVRADGFNIYSRVERIV